MYVGVAWIFPASYLISGSVSLGCPYVFLKLKFLGLAVEGESDQETSPPPHPLNRWLWGHKSPPGCYEWTNLTTAGNRTLADQPEVCSYTDCSILFWKHLGKEVSSHHQIVHISTFCDFLDISNGQSPVVKLVLLNTKDLVVTVAT
jgi:hypothetical protein